jgi:hypothetical protein
VAVLMGDTNSPMDWRMPIVIISTLAAITMKNQVEPGEVED